MDGASGICEGEISRRLVSNIEAETLEIGPTFRWGPKQLELDYTRNTSKSWDVSPSSRSSAVSPLGPMLEGGAMSLYFTVRGGEYGTKICNIRIDGASDICEGENFRRIASTERPKHEK